MFTYYNHSQLERFLTAFGLIFNRITIARNDPSGTEKQRMVVPIRYGPKGKWFTRDKQDPNLSQGVAMIVPQMAYQETNYRYDPTRKLISTNQITFPTPPNASKSERIYAGVPYVISMELAILVKNRADGLQIVEQILPFFTPDLTIAVAPIPGSSLLDRVPIILTNVSSTDDYEGAMEPRREIIFTLNFDMQVNFWGPQRKQSRIQQILVDFYISRLDDLQKSPDFIATEEGILFLLEDQPGHIADESTPDGYLQAGQIIHTDIDLVPPDQMPSTNTHVVTTFTEYDGDNPRREIHDEIVDTSNHGQ